MNWLQKTSQNDLVNHAKAVVQQSFDMVPSYFPPDLKSEIEYRFTSWVNGVELDEHFSEDVISETPFSLLYSTVSDIEDQDIRLRRSWIIAIRNWQIELGVYVAITPEEMQNTVVSGGKKYEFKINGVFYTFDKHPPGVQ